jgi:hypothetical protein
MLQKKTNLKNLSNFFSSFLSQTWTLFFGINFTSAAPRHSISEIFPAAQLGLLQPDAGLVNDLDNLTHAHFRPFCIHSIQLHIDAAKFFAAEECKLGQHSTLHVSNLISCPQVKNVVEDSSILVSESSLKNRRQFYQTVVAMSVVRLVELDAFPQVLLAEVGDHAFADHRLKHAYKL